MVIKVPYSEILEGIVNTLIILKFGKVWGILGLELLECCLTDYTECVHKCQVIIQTMGEYQVSVSGPYQACFKVSLPVITVDASHCYSRQKIPQNKTIC